MSTLPPNAGTGKTFAFYNITLVSEAPTSSHAGRRALGERWFILVSCALLTLLSCYPAPLHPECAHCRATGASINVPATALLVAPFTVKHTSPPSPPLDTPTQADLQRLGEFNGPAHPPLTTMSPVTVVFFWQFTQEDAPTHIILKGNSFVTNTFAPSPGPFVSAIVPTDRVHGLLALYPTCPSLYPTCNRDLHPPTRSQHVRSWPLLLYPATVI